MRIKIFTLGIIFSFPGLASIVPENNLMIPVSVKNQGLSESEYHEVINKFEAAYRPLLEESGKTLTIKRLWEDPRVNASTSRKGSEITINLFGGYARHMFTTPDAYMLVMCHELGHHVGGSPKKTDSNGKDRWPSVEGQADYFATLKCLRKMFSEDDNEALTGHISEKHYIRRKCEKVYESNKEVALCIRSTLAGVATAFISAEIRNTELPSVKTPDQTVVKKTIESHPLPQCRLDTYFQGALCSEQSDREFLSKNELKGTCHTLKGHTVGVRPRCWFRSSLFK